MDELLRNASGDIQIDLPQAPSAAPTVAIVDSAGTALTSGTSSQVGADTTLYKFTLTPAQLAVLDTYTATWTATIGGVADTYKTYVRVVGGFLFTIEQLRAFDTNLTALTYPDAKVREARVAATERLEQLMGVALRPMGRRITTNGLGTQDIILPNQEITRLVSGSIAGTALTASDLADVILYSTGLIRRSTLGYWTLGNRNITLHYEHGLLEASQPVRTAAMALCRAYLVGTEMWSRRSGEQTDVGFYRLTLAGRNTPTGIPEVDAVIEQFGWGVPSYA